LTNSESVHGQTESHESQLETHSHSKDSEPSEPSRVALSPVELSPYLPDRHHIRRKRRSRPNWYLIGVAVALLLGWAFHTFAWPFIEQSIRFRLRPSRAKFEVLLSSPIRELFQTCEYLTVIWFFYLGASIGSFFNVLAGRLPAGRGVVFGGSKCPFCNNRLSFLDNIPVIGYLACRGRCSTCKLPIAQRYLWMEILVGAIFLVVAFRELFSGGQNLPNYSTLAHVGIVNAVFYPKWPLIAAYVYHAMFFASLVMLSAANLERARFPWRAVWIFAAIFAGVKLVRLDHQFVRWHDIVSFTQPEWNPMLHAAMTVVLGGLGGLLIGGFTSFMLPPPVDDQTRNHWRQSFLLVGIVLGWQAVVLTSLVALFLSWVFAPWSTREAKFRSVPFFAILIGTVLLHHMFWGQIVSMISSLLATSFS
jgi:leader peptidase (prepilin peptidase) / N-methyltransferase